MLPNCNAPCPWILFRFNSFIYDMWVMRVLFYFFGTWLCGLLTGSINAMKKIKKGGHEKNIYLHFQALKGRKRLLGQPSYAFHELQSLHWHQQSKSFHAKIDDIWQRDFIAHGLEFMRNWHGAKILNKTLYCYNGLIAIIIDCYND